LFSVNTVCVAEEIQSGLDQPKAEVVELAGIKEQKNRLMTPNVLKLQNDYSYFVTDDVAAREFLWNKLRFQDRNYFHNRRYKQRLWDGYIEFFNRHTGRFLTGLLPEVRAVLKHLDLQYVTIDDRGLVSFDHTKIDEDFLNQWLPEKWVNGDKAMPVTLHDYQIDFIEQVVKHQRGVIYSPTSSGKTFIMVGIMKALPPGTPILVLQNRKSLAQQNFNEISNWGFPNVGQVGDGKFDPNVITVATVQSVAKLDKLLPKFKVLIVDEIHDMMSKLPKAVYRRLKSASVRVALSATPFKFGETDKVQKFYVKGFFGPVLKTKATASGILTTKELQDRKILASSKGTFFPIKEPMLPYDIYQDAVTNGIAESYYFHNIVCRLARQLSGRTLILVDRLAHGDALNALLPNSLWVQGKDDEKTRQSVIRQLQKMQSNVVAIATQQIFNTGINVHIHNLVNAAGGQAEHLIIQRMGRGLRTADDKEILNYYDFMFYINDYLLEHSRKRFKILKEEGHDITEAQEINF